MKNLLLFLFFGLSVGAFAQRDLSTFDLRDVDGVNYVSPVKSQEEGTCWTHAVMSAIEGNLLISGNWTAAGLEEVPDLSEYHLDWWNGFNSSFNQDQPDGSGIDVHQGGDYRVTSAYLSRGDGPIKDTTDYHSWLVSAPDHFATRYNRFYVRDIEWYTVGDNLERIQNVKDKLVKYGVMGTCMAYSSLFIDDSYVHYQPESNTMDPNHAISIIGWDDNKVTKASEPGAWLCKNSWGAYWGENGCFWISYYDKWSGKHPDMGAVSFQNVVEPFFDTIYYHDYHGWRDTRADISIAMNAFEANDTIKIKAVSFYTAADSVTYSLSIYKKFDKVTLSNEISSISGFIQNKGFHTFDLPKEVVVCQGKKFYMELELDKGGQPYDCTSDVPVLLGGDNKRTIVHSKSEPNQSFFKMDNQWNDFYNEGDNTGNFCIKAIADIYHGPLLGMSNSVNGINEMKVYPQPAQEIVTVEFLSDTEALGQLELINVSGVVQMSVPVQNMNKVQLNVASIPQGVYFVRVQTQNGPVVKQVLKY